MTSALGQGFTMSSNETLGKVEFYLKRSGSPSGYLIARLYAGELDVNGRIIPIDDPVNSGILAESSMVNFDNIRTSWGIYIRFRGFNYALIDGNMYVIQMEVYSGSGLDSSNDIDIWFSGDPDCKVGNFSAYLNEAWTSYAYDCVIKIYDDEDNIIYQCLYNECAPFYNTWLREVHPSIILPGVKSLPPKGGWGYYLLGEEYLKIEVDENGVLQTS